MVKEGGGGGGGHNKKYRWNSKTGESKENENC